MTVISLPITLILGAGASVPYGFPAARQLVLELCSKLQGVGGELSRILLDCGYEYREIEAFRDDLLRSYMPSVDAFLERRSDFLGIGMRAIAGALIPHENDGLLLRKDPMQWYEYLFGCLETRPENWGSNKLSIITFNYDRSLERSLMTAIMNAYNFNEVGAAKLLKQVPILHIYGSLGDLPHLGEDDLSYEPNATPERVRKAAERLHILAEGTAEPPVLDEARRLIKDAAVVCFLGFGYHEINLKRLRVADLRSGKTMHGSAFGLLSGQRSNIKQLLGGNAQLGDERADVLTYLRETGLLEWKGED